MSNAPVARCSAARPEDVAVDAVARRVDVGVGRHDDHHLVVGPVDGERRQGDRRGGVPAHRLEEHPAVGQLVADEALVAPVGHDRDVVRRQPGGRRLQERSSPSSGRNGFGRSGRLRGWSRVPPPPAMMTAYMRGPS